MNAVADAWEYKKVFAPKELELKIPGVEVVYYDDLLHMTRIAMCGLVIIDEGAIKLAAREWELLDKRVRQWLMEHRKYHCDIVTTTQDVRFIDKIFRVLSDEVRVVTMERKWFRYGRRSKSARPDMVHSVCGDVTVKGDTGRLARLFGWVTYFRWECYNASDLIGEVSSQFEPLPFDSGGRWFNIDVANSYDTMVSVLAKEDEDGRCERCGKKSEAKRVAVKYSR